MVTGITEWRRWLYELPNVVSQEVAASIERAAKATVSEMESLNPLPGTIEIGSEWNDGGRGEVSEGKAFGKNYSKITMRIYARAKGTASGFGGTADLSYIPAWFEFGTAERFHKSGHHTGKIISQPYFWPTIRKRKDSNKRRIAAAATRAIKKATK